MPVCTMRFQKGGTAFLSTPKFTMVTCIGINRNRRITMKCWLICKMAFGIRTDSKDCRLIIKGKGLFDSAVVCWDVAEEFFVSLR